MAILSTGRRDGPIRVDVSRSRCGKHWHVLQILRHGAIPLDRSRMGAPMKKMSDITGCLWRRRRASRCSSLPRRSIMAASACTFSSRGRGYRLRARLAAARAMASVEDENVLRQEIGAPGILAQAPERQHSVEEVASLWTDSLTASAVCSLENKSWMSLSALEIALKFLNSHSNRQRCTGRELKRLPLCGQLTASAVCSLEKTGPNSAPYLPDKVEKTYTVELTEPPLAHGCSSVFSLRIA